MKPEGLIFLVTESHVSPLRSSSLGVFKVGCSLWNLWKPTVRFSTNIQLSETLSELLGIIYWLLYSYSVFSTIISCNNCLSGATVALESHSFSLRLHFTNCSSMLRVSVARKRSGSNVLMSFIFLSFQHLSLKSWLSLKNWSETEMPACETQRNESNILCSFFKELKLVFP